jgi:ribose 5-phosphate isomerase B
MKKIVIGSDHAGFDYKQMIAAHLKEEGYEVIDVGTHSLDSVDYPDYAHQVAQKLTAEEAAMGVLICGSGVGVSIAANRHQGIRAALCWNEDIARLARQHNNANIIALPARFVSPDMAISMVETFMNTDFEGNRHQKRVEKIENFMC